MSRKMPLAHARAFFSDSFIPKTNERLRKTAGLEAMYCQLHF